MTLRDAVPTFVVSVDELAATVIDPVVLEGALDVAGIIPRRRNRSQGG